jgi:nucleotide-binding universal stress UspA family protein
MSTTTAAAGLTEFKVLFATQFSDSCFRAIRGVAQLADAFRMHVTIAHVGPAERAVESELRSFFAEADHYPSRDRIRLEGSPVEALSTFARSGAYDLVVAPRTYRLGLPRPLHRSTRAGLLRASQTPVWTISRGLEEADFRRTYKTVAVFVDGREQNMSHVEQAAAFAARVGAQLRVLTVVPQVHEDALVAHPLLRQPLSAEVAEERIHELLSGWSRLPTVDVTTGTPDRELPKMAAKCEADLLFLSETQSCEGRLFRQMRRAVDQSPCPVIAVPPTASRWFRERTIAGSQSAAAAAAETVRLLGGVATESAGTQAI